MYIPKINISNSKNRPHGNTPKGYIDSGPALTVRVWHLPSLSLKTNSASKYRKEQLPPLY